jgi:hypothetical protein
LINGAPRCNSQGVPFVCAAQNDRLDRFIINLLKPGSFGRRVYWTLEKHAEPHLHACGARNQEMYDNLAYLQNRQRDTDILQEYFVADDRMPQFVDGLREVIQRNRANSLSGTIRALHRDNITALPYAKQGIFGFAL